MGGGRRGTGKYRPFGQGSPVHSTAAARNGNPNPGTLIVLEPSFGGAMAASLLDGKLFASQIKAEVAEEVRQLAAAGMRPGLAAVLVGHNPASQSYVRSKVRTCEELGIFSELITPPQSIETEELIDVIERLNRRGDILVAAIGRPGFITTEFIKPGATILDVGINHIDDPVLFERFFKGDAPREKQFQEKGSTIIGDCDPRVMRIAGACTPVPGGVGKLTIAMLMSNTVKAAKLRRGIKPAKKPETTVQS